MPKLTDTQLTVLSNAAAREDGIAMIPGKLNKAAASKVAASLIARKLMREVRAKLGMPIWREDEHNRKVSLVITRAGRAATGVDHQAVKAREGKAPAGAYAKHSVSAIGSPRAGSKQALVVEMLSAKAGTTLKDLIEATGWLAHTTRAALTGLRKRGYVVQRETRPGKPSVYRMTSAELARAA